MRAGDIAVKNEEGGSSPAHRWLVVFGAIIGAVAGALVLVGLSSPVLLVAGAASEGVTAASEVPVTAMRRTAGLAHNSPQLAVHPENDGFMALANRLDDPFACALHVSGDGGETWTPVDPVSQLPEGAETCYGPEIAFGSDGTLYFLFVGLSGQGNTPMGVFLTTSDDGGRSFTEPRQILDELNFAVRLAVERTTGEPDRLHLAWIDAQDVGVGRFGPPPNPIMAAHSDDGGDTWSQPVQVSDPGRERVVAPALEVGSDGQVHVAYYDLLEDARDYQGLEGPVYDGHWELVMTSSTDGGESFAPDATVSDQVAPHERVMVVFTATPPALASGPNGKVCLAWADARHGSADVVARCSAEEGGWLPATRINDTPVDSDSTQDLPQLAIASNGRVDAIFYDGRRPPGDEFVDVFHAASTDGGRTFSDNTRISSHTSYTGFGPTFPALESAAGMVEFGSRLALVSAEERTVAAWADTRNANARSQGQAIFAARLVGLPGGPASAPLASRTIGAASIVAVAVAVGALVVLRRSRSPGQSAGVEPPPVQGAPR